MPFAAGSLAFRSPTKTRRAWRYYRCLWIICFSHNSRTSSVCCRCSAQLFAGLLAGVPGFEPGLSVLETDVLTVDTIPLRVSFTWSLCDQYACGNGDRTC